MILVTKLTKHFGEVTAVDQVTLRLRSNDALVILGPSGSGKTTLLRLIAGLDTPDAGEIHIDGKLCSKPGWILAPDRRGIGFVFQRPALWPHMTVAQNILFGLNGMDKMRARERLGEMLETMSLEHLAARYPDQISSGEAKRAAIARSLAPRPKWLLMDEPLTNLDSELKIRIHYAILETTRQTQASLIYVTHDLDEAEWISARTLRMKNGRLEPG